MEAVVSLLDPVHEARVLELWDELKRDFGVSGIDITPFPHFSYHVAVDYELGWLGGLLAQVAADTAPFAIRTSGLGIFTGPSPVLYLTVARNAPLTALHDRLWRALSHVSDGVSPWYHPDQWHPHISLGLHDLDADSLGAIVQRLAERDFHWTIPIDSLAVIAEGETSQVIGCRFGLSPVSEVR